MTLLCPKCGQSTGVAGPKLERAGLGMIRRVTCTHCRAPLPCPTCFGEASEDYIACWTCRRVPEHDRLLTDDPKIADALQAVVRSYHSRPGYRHASARRPGDVIVNEAQQLALLTMQATGAIVRPFEDLTVIAGLHLTLTDIVDLTRRGLIEPFEAQYGGARYRLTLGGMLSTPIVDQRRSPSG